VLADIDGDGCGDMAFALAGVTELGVGDFIL
jgi:hypothetical protein